MPAAATRVWLGWGAAVLLAGLWSYGNLIWELVKTWNNEPDYSHGFLVVPVAICFLWLRRPTCPGLQEGSLWVGLPLFFLSVVMRYLDGRYFLGFLEGWSLLVWVASVVTLLGGRALLVWSLPSIGFLAFMIPLPFSLEGALSQPLQGLATTISCWSLQLLGQPAFAEGNVILVGDDRLEVAQACSGLRLFMSITALAYGYIVIVRREWWEKLSLVVALVPIAIVSNSARIVATGLLYQFTSNQVLRQLAHKYAGWLMIAFAAALFGLVLWYLKRLIREDVVMDMTCLVRNRKVENK